MNDYIRATHSETLKLKGSQALILMVFAPITVVVMFFCVGLRNSIGGVSWLLSSSVTFWLALFLPLSIALETALLAEVETRGRQWKHLFAQPISRHALYTAKFVVGALLLGLSHLILGLGSWLSSRILSWIRPGMGFDAAFPWGHWLAFSGIVVLTSAWLLALHTWVVLRFRSFAVSVGAGVMGMLIAATVMFQDIWPYFPWRLPLHLIEGFQTVTYEPAWIWTGALGGVVCALLGSWEVTRRDVF